MARIDAFLKLGLAQGCSDLHLAVGVPPMLRMNGDLIPIKFRDLRDTELESYIAEILTPNQTDQFKRGVQPYLESQGIKVTATEFSNIIQINTALMDGSLDANVFQNRAFMDTFNAQQKGRLVEVLQVPSAPLGLYSSKHKDLKSLPNGASVAIPNEPTSMGRALAFLQLQGLHVGLEFFAVDAFGQVRKIAHVSACPPPAIVGGRGRSRRARYRSNSLSSYAPPLPQPLQPLPCSDQP